MNSCELLSAFIVVNIEKSNRQRADKVPQTTFYFPGSQGPYVVRDSDHCHSRTEHKFLRQLHLCVQEVVASKYVRNEKFSNRFISAPHVVILR
ncbi:hypothetical protein RB195_001418 [Necator americanus]|uniref:Uncharacterized protein n=1 Tax=Necator americanus TaxID=51031 RepID=A0ABR1DE74_NECAM